MKKRADCRTCGSKSPELHPAVQLDGEVEICPDEFHLTPTPRNTSDYISAVHAKRIMMEQGIRPREPNKVDSDIMTVYQK